MTITATVRQHDVWDGRGTVEIKSFSGDDCIEDAKRWAADNGAANSSEGFHILVLDHYSLFPEYKDENDFKLTWEK